MNNEQTDLTVLMQLDDLCEEYESQFAERKSPRIADFLDRVVPEHRGRLLHELVALEVGLLGDIGEKTSVEEILERYDNLLPEGEDREALRSTIEHAIASTKDANDTQIGVPETVPWDGNFTKAKPVTPEIDGFEIQSVLGRGGRGVVYKAIQTSLNRPVALKMILDHDAASGELIDRFEKEARAVAELNDPHFVQIYEFGVHQGRPYMTLEFVEGGTLEQLRQGEPQPEQFSAEIVESLSRAMHKAHAAGLVHRDLKPQNVLMSSDGQPKITDFGLVKRQQQDDTQKTEHGRVMGTASYMAPEQSRGEPDVGAAADVHALGGILYCLLTGRPPFLAATVYDTILQVRNQEPVPPSRLRPGISKDLETICLKCLHKETAKRYASAMELADDLRRSLEGRPIIARPVGAIERSWRWTKRNPLGATVAGLVVMIAVISSVMSWYLNLTINQVEIANSNVLAKNGELEATNEELEIEKQAANVARGRAVEAGRNAERARQNKSDQYNKSLTAIHRVVYNVDTLLRNDNQDVRFRKRILESALKSFDEVRDQGEKNTLIDRGEATACQRLGDIYVVLGDLKQALAQYDRTYEVTKQLLPENPTEFLLLRNLAIACDKQGEAKERLGNTLEARSSFEEGLQWRLRWDEELRLKKKLDHPPAKQAIARSQVRLGRLSLALGNAKASLEYLLKAQGWLQKAQEGCQKMPRASEDELAEYRDLNADLISDQIELDRWLGKTHHQLGNADEAERFLNQVKSSRDQLFDVRKSVGRLQARSRASLELGDFYLIERQDVAKAWEHYKPALEGYAQLWKREKQSAGTRAGLGNIEYRIGGLLRHAKDAGVTLEVPYGDDAQSHFETCCQLREALAAIDPDDMQAKIEWAVALARCGRAKEAEKQAEILVEKGQNNPRLLFQATCTFALCSEAEDKELAQRCRKRAFEVLKESIESGWKDRVALQDDPDLEPIRSDPRFEEFTKKLPSPGSSSQSDTRE